MKKSMLTIMIVAIFSCNDPWEKRDRIEAEDMCKCMEPWQKTVTKNLEQFYEQTADVSNDGNLGSASYDWDKIRAFKSVLSPSELEWNKRFGAVLSDRQSDFTKCWNRKYDWHNEIRPNNSYSNAFAYAYDMGCTLVAYIIDFKSDTAIMRVVFEE